MTRRRIHEPRPADGLWACTHPAVAGRARRRSGWGLPVAGLAGVIALLVSTPSQAQTYPADPQWLPLTSNMAPIGDPILDGTGARDLVGDATNPAAYVYTDGNHLFFRLRLDDTPLQTPTNYRPFGWACLFDTDGDLTSYEYVAGVDGIANPDIVEFSQNTSPSGVGDPSDGAETLLASYPTSSHARAVQAPSTFNASPDFFIDWAINVTDVQAAGITGGTPLRFICGTSNNARALTADLISETGATTLPDLSPDPVVCDATGCYPACADVGQACDTGQPGVCAAGLITCSGGNPVCTPGNNPAPEVCGDGLDNDCNGTVDEACDCQQDSDCGGPTSGTACDTQTSACVPGCRGQDGNGCPEGEVCSSTDDTIGTCGPIQVCDDDSDCGGPGSGTVCQVETQLCIPGCRGTDGNTCPAGEVCSSTDDTIGTCGPGEECAVDADCGGADSGSICDAGAHTCIAGCRGPGADGNSCPAGLECTSSDAAAGACVEPDTVVAEGSGCLCAAAGSPGDSPAWLAGLGALAMLGWRRRRRS